jgi:hypothetical protein
MPDMGELAGSNISLEWQKQAPACPQQGMTGSERPRPDQYQPDQHRHRSLITCNLHKILALTGVYKNK